MVVLLLAVGPPARVVGWFSMGVVCRVWSVLCYLDMAARGGAGGAVVCADGLCAVLQARQTRALLSVGERPHSNSSEVRAAAPAACQP